MGFQTTIMILNDALNEIDDDPTGWWEVTRAKIMAHNGVQCPTSYGFGGHSNGFKLVSVHHADVTSVIAVGGNSASILSQHMHHHHHNKESQEELLKKMADKMGYRLVKKAKTK